jgi:hypothetical protein
LRLKGAIMTDNTESSAELDRGDEIITLLVLARERPDVARALLAAADTAGVEPFAVRTTSDGFEVPRLLAQLAGLVLAEDVEPLDHLTPVYAAAIANGVDQVPPPSAELVDEQPPAEDLDEPPVDDAGLGDTPWAGPAELEAPRSRKAGRAGGKAADK